MARQTDGILTIIGRKPFSRPVRCRALGLRQLPGLVDNESGVTLTYPREWKPVLRVATD